VIHTIAGKGTAGFAGDSGPALDAQLDTPGGILLDGDGDVYFADTNNNRIRRLVPNPVVTPPQVYIPPPLSVVNAAGQTRGPVAPGEVVTIFGTAIGPKTAAVGVLDASGLLTNQVASVEVRFDGVPAPLFYVQASQINAQVPYTVSGNTLTHIEVFYQDSSMGTVDLAVVPAAPVIFSTVINQDGSYNSVTNPAPRGTLITFFATGEGLTNGPNVAGRPAAFPYPQPNLPVTVTVGGITAQVAFAGSAPGQVGLMQVNARVPGSFVPSGPVPLTLAVGTAISPDLTIWLQ
jgi:uncharacterized protein (TIGR03437 family)